MARLATVWGVPIERYPEPLQSALVVAFEREGVIGELWRASRWLATLLDLAYRWMINERMHGRM